MRERRLRDLVLGEPPGPDRILWSALWFRDHNNQRYSELIPRLERVDAFFVRAAAGRWPRAAQYRAYRYAPGRWAQRAIGPLAGRRYRSMLCTEVRQVAAFHGRIVVDVDDPHWSAEEAALFGRDNVVALVTTSREAADRYLALGVDKPCHVIPQGSGVGRLPEDEVREVAALRGPGDVVVGYMAAWLRTAGDRDGDNVLYNVDHLLELWDAIAPRAPSARLWLVGEPSERVRRLVAGRPDIALLGRQPRERVLAYVANFDVALYPRTRDSGVQAAKIAEYMGVGVPTVSYDYRVAEVLRETGSGWLVGSPSEFVDAVVALVDDEGRRGQLAEAARRAGAERDWDVLARRYETEILDRYLPPGR
jgi:glycosyltransferase involved in cell wall biosynthesis